MPAINHHTIAIFLIASVLLLSACSTSNELLPDEISLPDGIEVVSLELSEDEAGNLPASGRQGFSVTVTLNRAVPEGEWAIVAYAVRDVELIAGLPLCVGFVGMTSGDGTTATRENSFELVCEDGKVAGRATSSLYGMDEWDRSSGERRTGIYVQHIEGIRTFMGITIGIEGVKSNRITVSCPR